MRTLRQSKIVATTTSIAWIVLGTKYATSESLCMNGPSHGSPVLDAAQSSSASGRNFSLSTQHISEKAYKQLDV